MQSGSAARHICRSPLADASRIGHYVCAARYGGATLGPGKCSSCGAVHETAELYCAHCGAGLPNSMFQLFGTTRRSIAAWLKDPRSRRTYVVVATVALVGVAAWIREDHHATRTTYSAFFSGTPPAQPGAVKESFLVTTRAEATQDVFDRLSGNPKAVGLDAAPRLAALGDRIWVLIDYTMAPHSVERTRSLIAGLPGVTDVSS